MLEKMKTTLLRFMQGRYGADQLNTLLLTLAVLITLINSLTLRSAILTLLADILLIWTIFRMFSRNTWKRRKENNRYLELTRPVRSWFSLTRRRLTDREHRYFVCPRCHQNVRVPRGRGRIEITCPRCKTTFERKS